MGVNCEPSKTSGPVLKKAQDKCLGVEKAKEIVNL